VKRGTLLALALAAALILPAAASAHAYIVRTVPQANRPLARAPRQVLLTYSEPVEPKFAVVSVTDASGTQVATAPPESAPGNRDALVVPLERIPSGWYLVYWRVVSVDGHPVRGAFTFAVGPNPGPPPEFPVPSLNESVTTPALLVTRWIALLSMMTALGLFGLRIFVARPLIRVLSGSSLRALSTAFFGVLGVALVAAPVYAVLATAHFAARQFWELDAVLPAVRDSAFGRGFLDLAWVLALFAIAAAVALWLDRPEREQRSVAELLATGAAVAAGLAALVVPGIVGHAGQLSPRALGLALDSAHLLAGSVWIGGLAGLAVLWQTAPKLHRVGTLAYVVPRFSRVAFASVMLLLATGIWAATLELPTLASLWQTSYGKALVAKIGLLGATLVLASVNLARTKPRLAAANTRPAVASGAVVLLRRLVSGEVVLVVWAIFAAAVLTSLAPPSKALAGVKGVTARVGPGPVRQVIEKEGYRLSFQVTPNRAAVPNDFRVGITRAGQPVRGADVVARFTMLDMEMGELSYRLPEQQPGVFSRSAPALVMVGHWGLDFEITPPGRSPFNVLLLDKASG
jgi:copper transport protein